MKLILGNSGTQAVRGLTAIGCFGIFIGEGRHLKIHASIRQVSKRIKINYTTRHKNNIYKLKPIGMQQSIQIWKLRVNPHIPHILKLIK